MTLLNAAHIFDSVTLAWRPFLDPIEAHSWWLALSVPLIFLISMVYKSVRLPSLRFYWRQVIKMTLQLLVLLVVLCAGLFVLVEVALPRM